MGWTKKQLIEHAFKELGLGRDFDIGAEARQDALFSLDAMLATWNGKGIRLGYALPSSPDDSDIDADSGLPDGAVETVYASLAIRLAPSFGKTVSQDTRTTAKQGYDALLARAAFPPEQQLPSLPRGAGNKPWRGCGTPFTPKPTDPLLAAEGGDQIEFE